MRKHRMNYKKTAAAVVAGMMLSMAVITATAADSASTTFDVAVEVIDSTADATGNVLVTPGDTLEIKVVIKNNPGATLSQISFVYNTAELTPVVAEDGKEDMVCAALNGKNSSLKRTSLEM